jgi:hypothetical protein
MTEKRQTSQGYIIRILQHFATKLWNITNFVMLFEAVMKFLSISKYYYKGKGPLQTYICSFMFFKIIRKTHICTKHQYGFRQNRSTEFSIIELLDKITRAIDKEEYTIGIFLDLSKAFDTINHRILIKKLEYYGIRGMSQQWFQDYLTKNTIR